jgi:hypothetical protein
MYKKRIHFAAVPGLLFSICLLSREYDVHVVCHMLYVRGNHKDVLFARSFERLLRAKT